MSDSLFADLDIASAADNPFSVDDGTYEALLTAVKREEGSKGPGLVFEYTVQNDDKFEGRKFSEWKNLPVTPANKKEGWEITTPEKADEMKSWIKQRLTSLGVPEERMNSTNPSDLEGTAVIATLATKKGYQNITKLKVDEGTSSGESTGFEDFAGFTA